MTFYEVRRESITQDRGKKSIDRRRSEWVLVCMHDGTILWDTMLWGDVLLDAKLLEAMLRDAMLRDAMFRDATLYIRDTFIKLDTARG